MSRESLILQRFLGVPQGLWVSGIWCFILGFTVGILLVYSGLYAAVRLVVG